MIVGGAIAVGGTAALAYGAVRWLAGAIAPDDGRWLDLVGGHCQSGGEAERQACDREEAEDFRRRKATNDGNREAGGAAMIVGASVIATGAVVAVIGYTLRRSDVANAASGTASVRVLPVESPVRWVPHPDRGTTVIVPVVGGTW